MAESQVHSPNQNHILAALPAEDFARLEPHLELVPMKLGDYLYEPDEQMTHAYFPTTAIVSLHYAIESGASAQAAAVGNEGVVGVSLFMGGNTTPSSAVIQTGGHGYRLDRKRLKDEFDRSGPTMRILLRYVQALMTQMAQTSVCTRHHTVEQQLSRWLLTTLDRVASQNLVITQELVATLLGVRRESITEAAGRLRDEGFIVYRRGHMEVLKRAGLEDRVCECYDVVKTEFARLMSDIPRVKAAA